MGVSVATQARMVSTQEIATLTVLLLCLTTHHGVDAGYSVSCDSTYAEWGEWTPVAGSTVFQERTRTATEKRTDPDRNVGGNIMNNIRYPEVVKQAFLAMLKKAVC